VNTFAVDAQKRKVSPVVVTTQLDHHDATPVLNQTVRALCAERERIAQVCGRRTPRRAPGDLLHPCRTQAGRAPAAMRAAMTRCNVSSIERTFASIVLRAIASWL
jgi:hypothetical protein